MKSLLHIFTFLCVVLLVASTHADSTAEDYWKTVLPNAKMPNAIKSLIKSDQSNVLEASSNVKDPNGQEAAFHLDNGDDDDDDHRRHRFSYNSYHDLKSKEQAAFHLDNGDDDDDDHRRHRFSYNSYHDAKSKEQATLHLDDDDDHDGKKFMYHHYDASKSNVQNVPDQSNVVLEASSNVKDPTVQEAFHLDDDDFDKKRRFRYTDYNDASKLKEQATVHLGDDDLDNHHHHCHHYGALKSKDQGDDDFGNGHHHCHHYGASKSKDQATSHLDDNDDFGNGHHCHHDDASKSEDQATFPLGNDDLHNGHHHCHHDDASKSEDQATFPLGNDDLHNGHHHCHHDDASKSEDQATFPLGDDDLHNGDHHCHHYGASKSKEEATSPLGEDDLDNGHHHCHHYGALKSNDQATFQLDGDDLDNGHHCHHYGASESKEEATFHLGDDDLDNHRHHFRAYGASKSNVQLATSKDHIPQLTYTKKKPLKKTSNTTMFFLQRDLALRKKWNLDFFQEGPPSSTHKFVPRQKSNSIPFSSSKLPEILTRFSVSPNSREAEAINETIRACEEPEMKGEKKFCATSLEDMIDSTISMLGNTTTTKVEAISTETKNATGSHQNYTIKGVKKMAKNSSISCHRQAYPYAVFYCHKTSATEVYMVSLVGNHGGRVQAPVICHLDTSAWDPQHMAFVLLKVAPGTLPICHFLPKDHVVWIKK